ncbi:hypothetical protein G3R49_10240 [Shewanella sp. WXL01]|uniref:hypothetical protein n=1 Tax=Shewanella sp. WXL01 TaxID=2709721 RepID=UPI001438290F|nr:hypothetical protein [Shewanella sp. WXL01]NKF50940.1 hypothetical protein [Shewanella sp. WXL01]
MKTINLTLISLALVAVSSQVCAQEVAQCKQDAKSALCQQYLKGVVDGALMFKADASAAQKINANDYESRALKYRAGKRHKIASQHYCESKKADKGEMVSALTEQVAMNNVNNVEDLEIVITSLMDCRLGN